MPLLQAHGQRDIDGGGVMAEIDAEMWQDLIEVLKDISRLLEIIGDRM